MALHPVQDHELEQVAAFVNAAYRGLGGQAGWSQEGNYISGPRTTAEILHEDLKAAPEAKLMVWRDEPDGPPLGCVWLEPAPDGAWRLGLLTVRSDLQDRKLGRAVLEAAEAMAAEAGASHIRMTVISLREALIAWYGRRGYVRTGTRPFPYDDARLGEPQRQDLSFAVLEKPLRTPG